MDEIVKLEQELIQRGDLLMEIRKVLWDRKQGELLNFLFVDDLIVKIDEVMK